MHVIAIYSTYLSPPGTRSPRGTGRGSDPFYCKFRVCICVMYVVCVVGCWCVFGMVCFVCILCVVLCLFSVCLYIWMRDWGERG